MEHPNPDEEYEQVAKEIIERVKELEVSEKWEENGTQPCIKHKMWIGNRVASKGTHIVEHPF